jgi:hypothetical protein
MTLFNLTMHNQKQLTKLDLSAFGVSEVEIQPRLSPVDKPADYEALKKVVRDAVAGIAPGSSVLIGGLGQFQALINQLPFKFFFADFDPQERRVVGLIPHQPFTRQEIFKIEKSLNEPEAQPVEWSWNNGIGSRSRRPRCLVLAPNGDIHRFTGQSIAGVVKVLGSDYKKNGKWSNSTFRCISPPGTVTISWKQDWETGETFGQDYWREVEEWLLKYAKHADFEQLVTIIRDAWPKIATRLDENESATVAFSTE